MEMLPAGVEEHRQYREHWLLPSIWLVLTQDPTAPHQLEYTTRLIKMKIAGRRHKTPRLADHRAVRLVQRTIHQVVRRLLAHVQRLVPHPMSTILPQVHY